MRIAGWQEQPSSSRCWPLITFGSCLLTATLITAAGFVVVTRCLVGRIPAGRQLLPVDHVPNGPESHIAATLSCLMEYATERSEPNDVVFVGDSSCSCGVVPMLFEERTGLRAYNLGAVGHIGIDGSNFILSSYLQHHNPPPRVVVWCWHPWELGTEHDPLEPWVRARFFELYRVSGKRTWDTHLQSISHSAALGTRDLLESTLGRFLDCCTPMPEPCIYTVQSLTTQRGFWELGGLPPPKVTRRRLSPLDGESEKNLIALAQLTARYGITLIIRLTPVMAGTMEGDPVDVRDCLRRLETAFPSQVRVCRPEVVEYAPEYFYERQHCNRAGAEKFTTLLAEEVPRAMAAGAVSATGRTKLRPP
jgi:hypothetical protein